MRAIRDRFSPINDQDDPPALPSDGSVQLPVFGTRQQPLPSFVQHGTVFHRTVIAASCATLTFRVLTSGVLWLSVNGHVIVCSGDEALCNANADGSPWNESNDFVDRGDGRLGRSISMFRFTPQNLPLRSDGKQVS